MADLLAREDLGNPSSVHRRGQAARAVVEAARRAVAQAVGAEPLEVTFTSGGTESDVLGIVGTAAARRRAGAPAGLLTSTIEHPAVLGAARRLADDGVAVVMLEPDAAGRIDPALLTAALQAHPEVGVVSLAAANHELGNVYDLEALVAAARGVAPTATIHVDAVQAFGKRPVSRAGWGVDLISISAHKIHGPPGVGALVHARGHRLEPLLGPGHHERGRRPGTEALHLVHGFGVAAQLATQDFAWVDGARALHERLARGLTALGGRVHGDPAMHLGTTLTVAFPGCDAQLLLIALDLEGIAVSTGAACEAGTAEPSAVLQALGHADDARASLRLSLSRTSTAADVDGLLRALPPIVQRVRRAPTSPVSQARVPSVPAASTEAS